MTTPGTSRQCDCRGDQGEYLRVGAGFVAMDAQLKLLRIGIEATSFYDAHVQTYLAAFPGDVALAISDSGNTKTWSVLCWSPKSAGRNDLYYRRSRFGG